MPTKKQTATNGGKGKKTTTIAPIKKTVVSKKSPKKTDPIVLPVMPLLEI